MLYRQKFDTFIRIYNEIGYITNRGNFSDRITDASGAIFLKALSRKTKTLEELSAEIIKAFINADINIIRKDAADFYAMLEKDGFIVGGANEAELNKKDIRFSYKELNPQTIKKDFAAKEMRTDKSSQDYFNERFKDKPQLMQFQIELTSRCNERCIHCYIPHENKISDIDPALYYKTLEQCKDLGILNLTLSGGEPMLHPNFSDFLRKAKEYDFSISVLSNLTLLNDDIINELKENRLSSVQVSLYSMNPEIHDAITQQKGSFEKTKASILKLIENDIPLQVSCPTMKQNKNSYVDVLNWSHKNKVRATTDFIMMARYDHSADNLDNRLDVDEVETVIKDILENDSAYQESIKETDFTELDKRDISNDIICGVCISNLCMVADGSVYPCAGWQDYIVGNIRDQTLKDIWENSPKVKYLRSLRKKDFPKCLDCSEKTFCAMCMVRNANENPKGDPLKINEHFCKVAKINKKMAMDWKIKNNGGGAK
ncbi:MAG: radical SAM protein [Elusimicrobiota bacterium]|jgi:radical SAM protein with 4Fe4S-binding SPASM domain|nr:radical SAM protein [Elusimicrobiota bacterium]